MKIKLIAEGSTKWQRFIKRWGISFLIGENVLFDTFGREDIFWRNIKRFKIDISKIKHVIISHEDWDHIAGLESFLKKNPHVTVYICKQSPLKLKEMILSSGATLVEVDKLLEITKNVFTLGQMHAVTKRGVLYEQPIGIRTEKGIVVLTGCAHPGLIAILDEVKKHFNESIFLIAGGFHLKNSPQEDIDLIIGALKSAGVQKVVPLHCTGKRAADRMLDALGEGFMRIKEGDNIM